MAGTEVNGKRIHVLHVLLNLDPGGLENGVVNVVNGLDKQEFHSSVCCLQHKGVFAQRIQGDTIVFEMGHTKGNNFLLPLRLAARMRTLRPDIVHTRNPESFFYGFVAAKLAGVTAIVHSEHGRNFPDSNLRHRVQGIFSKHTDCIFALTGNLRDSLIKHVGIAPEKIDVIYNGVDLKKFQSYECSTIRQQIGAGNRLVVGSVGRLVSIKNYKLLIEAMHLLRNRFDLMLVLIGDGPERANLEAQAKGQGLAKHIVFLGHQNDVHKLIGGMDIFVLPSINEGMSNTLIEALAARIPCVASSVGGNPEIIRQNRDGLLFESNDATGLANCIAMLCESPELRSRLAESGRERTISQFSLETMIDNYQRLYRRALHGR
ncbi:MAG: glycosyltransferase [Betaproteobacteria bacterium]